MSKRQMILDSLIKKENSRMDDDILAGNIVDEVVDSNKISLKMISIMERGASEVFLNYLNRETIGRTRRDIFRTHPNLKPSPDKDQRKNQNQLIQIKMFQNLLVIKMIQNLLNFKKPYRVSVKRYLKMIHLMKQVMK